MSEEGDTIFTWIYGDEKYIRTRSGTDLTGYKYDQIKYPTMKGLMPKMEGKKSEQMRIHHLVFVTFADDMAIERFFRGLSIDHINRNIGDSRWGGGGNRMKLDCVEEDYEQDEEEFSPDAY